MKAVVGIATGCAIDRVVWRVQGFLFLTKQSHFRGGVPVRCMRMGWLILDES